MNDETALSQITALSHVTAVSDIAASSDAVITTTTDSSQKTLTQGNNPSFQAQQQQFCAWLRDPTQHPLPADVAPARMQVYRELLYHNVCNFIDMVYPVAQVLLGQVQWQHWQQQFFATYRCSSPFYLDISLHFRDFLQEGGASDAEMMQYPWLHELLQYEWLELYLDTMPNDQQSLSTEPTPFTWQLNLPVWVLVYQYPVYEWHTHMKPDTIKNISATPSAIVVWRDHDFRVQIQPISPFQAMLLSALQQQFEQGDVAFSTQDVFDICQKQCVDLSKDTLGSAIAELKQQLQDWQLLPL